MGGALGPSLDRGPLLGRCAPALARRGALPADARPVGAARRLPARDLCALTVVTLAIGQLQHTKVVGRLRWLDPWLATPSNHRVHHGSNPQYLDKNFGSSLMIWDRLFGTFEREEERVTFGLSETPLLPGVIGTAAGLYPAMLRARRAAQRREPAAHPIARRPRRASGCRRRSSIACRAGCRSGHREREERDQWSGARVGRLAARDVALALTRGAAPTARGPRP